MSKGPKVKIYANGRLTAKQNGFVNGILEGKSQTQAAMDVYNTTSENVAHVIAAENLRKHTIKQTIQEAIAESGLTFAKSLKNLNKIASKEAKSVKTDSVIKANVEILKILGAYPGQKHLHVGLNVNAEINNMNFTEIKQELGKIDSELQQLFPEEAHSVVNKEG